MDFDQPLLPQTKAWIRAVDTDSDPFTTFIRFAAIEIIAESISIDILASKIFTSVLGERGCQWFRVHAEHESGMTHEELEIRLAFAFAEGTPTKESVNGIIQCIVDLFVVAGEVCVGLGKRQPHRKLAPLS